jgi:allophanate hydrolase subunit 2
VLREGLDGSLGRPLREAEHVSWIGAPAPELLRSVPAELVPDASPVIELPLITGYEWHLFSAEARDAAWASEWSIDVASDRVACRLQGPMLRSGPSALDSTPLLDGTVQVPGNGIPLIFMRDRPTVGGYPKLGSVDPGALDRLAQARPGTGVRFVPADPADVLKRLRERRSFFGLA